MKLSFTSLLVALSVLTVSHADPTYEQETWNGTFKQKVIAQEERVMKIRFDPQIVLKHLEDDDDDDNDNIIMDDFNNEAYPSPEHVQGVCFNDVRQGDYSRISGVKNPVRHVVLKKDMLGSYTEIEFTSDEFRWDASEGSNCTIEHVHQDKLYCEALLWAEFITNPNDYNLGAAYEPSDHLVEFVQHLLDTNYNKLAKKIEHDGRHPPVIYYHPIFDEPNIEIEEHIRTYHAKTFRGVVLSVILNKFNHLFDKIQVNL
jgi:hypothetical protein